MSFTTGDVATAFLALGQWVSVPTEQRRLAVYTNRDIVQAYKPTRADVPDGELTQEVWALTPTPVDLVRVVKPPLLREVWTRAADFFDLANQEGIDEAVYAWELNNGLGAELGVDEDLTEYYQDLGVQYSSEAAAPWALDLIRAGLAESAHAGFLKKTGRGAANRAHPAGAVAPPEGLWRLDACHGYYLRWYWPGSRLTGRLKYRRFKEVHKTSSLRAWWLREFATVANELQLRPEGISPRVLRRVARGGWLRTPVGAPDEVRLAALRDAYRDHFAGAGRGTRAPNPGFRTVQAALGSDWPDDAVWLVHNTAVAVAAEVRRPWPDYAEVLGRAGERIEDELMRYTPSGDVEVSWRSRWQDGGLGHEIEQALEAYNETA